MIDLSDQPYIVTVDGDFHPEEGEILLLGVDRSHGLILIDGELHWVPLEHVHVQTAMRLYQPVEGPGPIQAE